jgi:D-alanyl-D-alanine carboxypeptidase
MSIWIKGAAAALAVAVATSGGVAQAATPRPRPGLTAALRADLNRYLDAQGVEDHISALSVRVTYPGARPALAVSVGASDEAEWQIGSNTKAFTSVVLLQLEAEKRLSVNDRLGRWLPQYPAWRDVTVKQLLSMTSGIADYTATDAFGAQIQADLGASFTPETMLSWVKDLPLGPAGYAYSNTNYLLAQLIVERASHDSYFHQVHQRILRPLGLHDTCFAPETCSAGVADRMPIGYSVVLGRPVPPLAVSWGQGAGGLVSTLKDMTTWDRALYGGRELPAAQQRELESLISITTSKPIQTVTPADPFGYGLGVAQRTDPVTGVTWSYEGATLGFRVVHLYFPATGLLIAIAVDSAVETDSLPTLADSLYHTLSA